MKSISESTTFTSDWNSVWRRVSDIGSMPEYWHGQRSIHVEERSKGVFSASVIFAFGGKGHAIVEVDEGMREVRLTYTSGPFRGIQRVQVSDGTLTAEWHIVFKGLYRFASPFMRSHFRAGTVHALERLCYSRENTE